MPTFVRNLRVFSIEKSRLFGFIALVKCNSNHVVYLMNTPNVVSESHSKTMRSVQIMRILFHLSSGNTPFLLLTKKKKKCFHIVRNQLDFVVLPNFINFFDKILY